VLTSAWIADLADGNDLLQSHYPNIQHFVIGTSDCWVEVLSEEEPEITDLKVPTPQGGAVG